MKIDLFLDSRDYGGIEAHVFQLARALVAERHQVTVLFFKRYGDHPLAQALMNEGVAVEFLSGQWRHALNTLKQRGSDILHTHGYKAGIIGRFSTLGRKTACCSSFHAGEKSYGKLALYTWLDRSTAFLAQKIIAVSDEIARHLPVNAKVLRNFVDVKLHNHQGRDIAFVGRLSFEKGPDILLDIAKIFPDQQFHIYGDGPMRAQLEQSATNNVVFHGRVDMKQHWPQIGLLLMPSRAEGLPLAALEAMAAGVNVVASPVGDLPKLISNTKNGWLAKNTPSQFSKAIGHWLRLDYWQRKTMSYSAQIHIARHYSTEAVIPSFIECYQSALACRQAGPIESGHHA